MFILLYGTYAYLMVNIQIIVNFPDVWLFAFGGLFNPEYSNSKQTFAYQGAHSQGCIDPYITYQGAPSQGWIDPYITFQVFEYPCFNTRMFFNLRVLKDRDSKISVFYTQRFLKLCVLKHGDWRIEQFCPTKPPCSNTRRFLNLRVLKYRDSKISVFKPWRFLNLVFCNTEIKKSPCFGTRR